MAGIVWEISRTIIIVIFTYEADKRDLTATRANENINGGRGSCG